MTTNEILIDSQWKFVAAVSGGGQEVFGDLTKHGGMSSTLLQGIIPYSFPAFESLIGGKVDHIVSGPAVRAAAMACYRQAMKFAPNQQVFGFASTGSVVKAGGEREGRKHRVFMAIQDYERTIEVSILLGVKRTREEEESLVAACIYEVLKWGCHRFGDVKRLLNIETGDEFSIDTSTANRDIRDLVHESISLCSESNPKAIFSSSCNPFHDGHLAITQDAALRLGCKVDIELCIFNADKPPLDYMTIRDRLSKTRDFVYNYPHIGEVVLTNKPLFFDKVQLFPGATFILGADTLDRIVDTKYYSGGYHDIDIGFDVMESIGSRLLVYPRGGYEMKEDVNLLPSRGSQVTTMVSVSDGYKPSVISSTAIRQEMRNGNA